MFLVYTPGLQYPFPHLMFKGEFRIVSRPLWNSAGRNSSAPYGFSDLKIPTALILLSEDTSFATPQIPFRLLLADTKHRRKSNLKVLRISISSTSATSFYTLIVRWYSFMYLIKNSYLLSSLTLTMGWVLSSEPDWHAHNDPPLPPIKSLALVPYIAKLVIQFDSAMEKALHYAFYVMSHNLSAHV